MPDKPRCFIVTVGGSLIEKYNDAPSRKIEFTTKSIENTYPDGWGRNVWQRWESTLDFAKNKISKWLEGQNTLEAFRKRSAELNSLYHIQPVPGEVEGDKVVLIATRTPVGLLCSGLLKQALTDIEITPDKVKISVDKPIYPEGLGKADDSTFVTDGLPNFISDLSRQIQNHSKDYKVILIPTGGYKSLIPYATLAGILHGKEIKYIYEESNKLMSLLSIPVNLDIEKWQPAYVKLGVLTNQPAKNTSAYYENLDQSFKNLLEPLSDKNQPYKFNVMGKFLKQRYLQLRHQTPLEFQTIGTSLLKYLKRDDGKPDLQEFFRQLTEIGPYLWFGDKVPEMAEHALHHHTNLFEIAEILLLPILHNQNNFLSSEELFVLLCTIYFHDWGHVISYLNEKPLLPTQIRDFHHILGYERLKDLGWRKELIKNDLHWIGNETSDEKADELWKKYLNLIAIIGLFHRKKMPLKESDTSYPCPVNGRTYVSLGKQAKNQNDEDNDKGWFLWFEGKRFSNERATLIASLFRIIDSLDNQLARMGAPEEIRMKAAVVRNDAEHAEHHREEIEKMLTQYLEGKSCAVLKQEIDRLIEDIIGSYQNRESNGTSGRRRRKSEELDLEGEIDKLTLNKFSRSESEFAKSLIHLYIDGRCWAFFKKEQPKHYLKHLALKNPIISYSYDKKKHIVTIKLEKEGNSRLKEYCEVFGLDPVEDLPRVDKIIDGIKEEYDKVRSILNENDLEIVYQS